MPRVRNISYSSYRPVEFNFAGRSGMSERKLVILSGDAPFVTREEKLKNTYHYFWEDDPCNYSYSGSVISHVTHVIDYDISDDGKNTVYLPDGKYTYYSSQFRPLKPVPDYIRCATTSVHTGMDTMVSVLDKLDRTVKYAALRDTFTVSGEALRPAVLQYDSFATLTVQFKDEKGGTLSGFVTVSNQRAFVDRYLSGDEQKQMRLPAGVYDYTFFFTDYKSYAPKTGTLTVKGAEAVTETILCVKSLNRN
jgi:hypothetical protein